MPVTLDKCPARADLHHFIWGGREAGPTIALSFRCYVFQIFSEVTLLVQDPRDCHGKLLGHTHFCNSSPDAVLQNGDEDEDRGTGSAAEAHLEAFTREAELNPT